MIPTQLVIGNAEIYLLIRELLGIKAFKLRGFQEFLIHSRKILLTDRRFPCSGAAKHI